jgi:hypothetical protein
MSIDTFLELHVLVGAMAGRDKHGKHVPRHGSIEHRGMDAVPKSSSGLDRSHRFAEIFPLLPSYDRSERFLERLGARSYDVRRLDHDAVEFVTETHTGPMFEDPDNPVGNSTRIPAGVAFLGQFLDHDVTLDPTSSLDRANDPAALENFRTPRLDLDCVYGDGPEVDPFLYEEREHDGESYLGMLVDEHDGVLDLPRNANGVALIGDPRNDENLVVSQLQLALLRFHNAVAEHVIDTPGLREPGESTFEAARRLVRWHYQWVILNEFLPLICDESVVGEVRRHGPRQFRVSHGRASIPVEFAGAAYRYGHSQIRSTYVVNDASGPVRFFPDPETPNQPSLVGDRPLPAAMEIEWHRFFDFDTTDLQAARAIDSKIAPDLFHLPFVETVEAGSGITEARAAELNRRVSLPVRNLLRGLHLGLPSGQAVAREIGADVLSNEELGLGTFLEATGREGDREAPLWFYVLAEARVQSDGRHLGQVGSRIVAETLYGLVASDPGSYLHAETWGPVLPRAAAGRYTMADLLSFALDLDVGPELAFGAETAPAEPMEVGTEAED